MPTTTTTTTTTGAETVAAMVLAAADRYGGATALRSERDGVWHDISYGELGESARAIARGLIGLGIEPGDRVAILASTRPERTLVDCGAMCAGAVVVPIDPTSSPEECRYVFEHSEAHTVICEDVEQLDKISRIQGDCPALRHVIAFDGAHGRAPSLDGLRAGGMTVDESVPDRIVEALRPHDPATIVYTPGTTGHPEGRTLTHSDWIRALLAYESSVDADDDVPHITQMVVLNAGGTLAF